MTLNQVKKQLREIVLTHGQVNSFYWGDITDWTEFTGLAYPSVLITLNDATTNNPLTDLNISLWVSERLASDNSNRDDALSDTLQIVNDLLSSIDDYTNWRPDIKGKAISFYEDKMGNDNADIVAGCRVDIPISIFTPRDTCQVPTREGRFIITEQGYMIITEDGNAIITE